MQVPSSTYELIQQASATAPARSASTYLASAELDMPAIEVSRQVLLERIHQVANMLGALGVGATDVVSCLLPHRLEAQAAFWGAQAAGIVNPVNFLLGARQIADILNAVRSKVLIAAGPHCDAVIWDKVEALRAHVPTLEAIVVIGGPRDPGRDIHDFAEATACFPAQRLTTERRIAPHETAAIFHTSGSTGHPKLVRHTHRNEVWAAVSTARLFEFTDQDLVANGMPLFHVAAPILLSLAPWAAGAGILIPTEAGMRHPRVLQNYWKLVERHGVTIPGGVPTSLLELTQVPIGDADLSSARFAITGGAPLPRGLAERFRQHTGLEVRQMYGMTETAGIIAGAPRTMPIEPGAIGVCAPGVQLKILQAGGSTECGPGETGEVHVRGPNVVHECLVGHGWFNTGDVGYLDHHGVLSLTGRTKDVIIRSGHNIDPATIEAAACRHAAVKTCAAVGQPDKRAGEVPVLFVVLETGATADADELQKFIAGQVAEPPAKPARVLIVDALPLNAVGKIFRPRLRCQAISHVIHGEIGDVVAAAGIACAVHVDLDEGSLIKSRIELDCATVGADAAQRCKDALRRKLDQYPIHLSIECR